MTFRPIWILAMVFLMHSATASSQTLEYQGYTEYDGRSATLTLTFSGLSVIGELRVNPVCEQNTHLTGVHLKLSGTATGPWEDRNTAITGDWTGGDLDPCSGSTITDDPSYPTEGRFTISIDEIGSEGTVRLVRMPTGYGYKFKAKGVVLSGSSGNGNPDLKITDISVPTGIGPGMITKIVAAFMNDGSSDAGPFKLYGYAIPSQDYKKMYKSDPAAVQGLEAGETDSTIIPISIPSSAPTGSFDIKVAIDNSNYAGPGDVLETNENNNEMWKRKVSGPEAKTQAGEQADLIVTEVRYDPSQVQTSDKLTFIMGLKNLGGAQAKGFNAGFYLSTDRDITTDDIYIGYGVIDLGPGEAKSGPVPGNLPADLVPGLYYIGVIADPLEKLAESDETNNIGSTVESVFVPTSFTRISNDVLASNVPGSQSEAVYTQVGQTYTYQMPPAAFADGRSFAEQNIVSLTPSDYKNFVQWGPTGVLSGDGEETLGTSSSITLTAMKKGTATVRMTIFWEARRSDGKVSQGYQDFTWNVIVGLDYTNGNLDKNKPSSSAISAKKGEITSGKIRGKVVYQPTGEPVAGATIHSIVFENEAKGGYPVHRLNPDRSVKEMLKTGTDGSFEIDISKWVPSGLDSGRFWIKIIKPYDGYLTRKTWETVCLDLWVVQSPLKTFSLNRDSLQAGTVNVGVINMDRASKAVPGMECPIDPDTGRPIDDAGWP
jgi:hypothetical protein